MESVGVERPRYGVKKEDDSERGPLERLCWTVGVDAYG